MRMEDEKMTYATRGSYEMLEIDKKQNATHPVISCWVLRVKPIEPKSSTHRARLVRICVCDRDLVNCKL